MAAPALRPAAAVTFRRSTNGVWTLRPPVGGEGRVRKADQERGRAEGLSSLRECARVRNDIYSSISN